MRHISLTLILLFSLSISGISQKVKYKDLFILLKAENYKDADIYLRSFLTGDPDHPSANYQMGKMLQNYMYAEDLMKNSNRAIELADSSLIYYQNALNFITEKEVKKHDDDYYSEFRRRDLRSGKFAVKINDVQLDIETRNEDIRTYKQGVAQLNLHFIAATTFYDSCQINYNIFSEKAESTNVLYFNTGAEELQKFREISSLYDSCIYNFNTYRAIIKGMSKSTLVQKIEEKPIQTFPDDGMSKTDFYAETVEFWHYGKWSNSMLDIIGKQIYPLKKRMIEYDEKLNTLHNTIVEDSLDGRPQIFKLATENVGSDIRDYDANSLPAAIYNYRIAEINYHSALNHWYNEIIDTTHVGIKMDALVDFDKQTAGISKLLNNLIDVNTPLQKRVFKDYIIARYHDNNGIDEFIKGQMAEVLRDSLQLEIWLKNVKEQDKITIWHQDSISLIVGEQFINNDSLKFRTVMVDSLTGRNVGFYALMEDLESVSFSYSISPSNRVLDTLYAIPIDPLLVEQRLINLNYLADSIGVNQRIWVFNSTSPNKENKFKAQIFLTDLSDGTKWNKIVDLQESPRQLIIDDENKKIEVIGDSENTLIAFDMFGEELDPAEIDGGAKEN